MARFAVKPPTEVRLSELQAQYLTTRDAKNPTDSEFYQQMFVELMPYIRSLILKQTTGKVYLPPEVVQDAVVEVAIKFMELYKRPDFKIASSFAGYIHLKILETLYGAKKIKDDAVLSLNSLVDATTSRGTELGELADTLKFTLLSEAQTRRQQEDPADYLFEKSGYAVKTASSLVPDVFSSTTSLKEAIHLSVGLLLFIRKTRYTKFYEDYLNDNEREALDLSIWELRKRLEGTD